MIICDCKAKSQVGIAVVNYNGLEYSGKCLYLLLAIDYPNLLMLSYASLLQKWVARDPS